MEALWQRTLLEKQTHSHWKKLKRSLENTSVALFPSPPGQPFLREEGSSRPWCARPRDCLGVRSMKYVSKLSLCDPRFNWVHNAVCKKLYAKNYGWMLQPLSVKLFTSPAVRAELISSLLLPVIYLACCLSFLVISCWILWVEGWDSITF